LSYLANTQTNKQTNKVWQKHNLLGGGNYFREDLRFEPPEKSRQPLMIRQVVSDLWTDNRECSAADSWQKTLADGYCRQT